MSRSALAAGVRHLRRVLATQRHRDESDELLLHAFADCRDDSAFAVLVRRHGPMVMGVCRRVLGHQQDAEDAFQATFLVLARNAHALRNKAAVAAFLHGTAQRTALKAKQAAARRRKHERQAAVRMTDSPCEDLLWREVRTLLDEEIARLPEKYRSVFVLCSLENVSRAEAARRLGLKEGTVSSRLTEARQRLQRRLSRRGVELTALLAAMALTTEAALALPVALLTKTIGGTVSPAVAALADSGSAILSLGKTKLVAGILFSVSVLASAGLWAGRTLTALPSSLPPSETANPPERAKAKATKSVVLTGRVLDPDGKPVKDARLYSPHLLKDPPESYDDVTVVQRGVTDADGRFRVELPRADVPLEGGAFLIAAADGYGVDWIDLPKNDSPAELTLRLVKDQAVRGRIINTEGKPLTGVRVQVRALMMKPDGTLDDFLTAWERDWEIARRRAPKQLEGPLDGVFSAVTDKEGRFRIQSIGAERVAVLQVSGAGVAKELLYVISRSGFDPASVNKVVRDAIPPELRRPDGPPLLYGLTFDYVAQPMRVIEGTVREAGTGEPVAGFTISSIVGYDTVVSAVSDKQGHYRLIGLTKRKQYLLTAEPPENSSWLRAGARPADTEGLQPLKVDFTVARGIVVTGRVIDKTTGKGLQSSLNFAPLPENKYFGKPGRDSYRYERLSNPTDAEGRFRLAVLPGPVVLTVLAEGGEKTKDGQTVNPYMPAEFDAADRKRLSVIETEDGERYILAADNKREYFSNANAVKRLDLAPDARKPRCDLVLQRGRTLAVKIRDPQGEPLSGAAIAGMTASGSVYPAVREAEITVFALNPDKPRRLLFLHLGRQLAGLLTVRGDEKEPPVARLERTGGVTGRLLDSDGQPIAGVVISPSFEDGAARALYQHVDQPGRSPCTDKDGRFRLEGIIPGLKFGIGLRHGRTFLVGEPRIGLRQVKPGETLGLGDIRTKPR
jgi:RNA polymerase sigma factor (sigma-70 family)